LEFRDVSFKYPSRDKKSLSQAGDNDEASVALDVDDEFSKRVSSLMKNKEVKDVKEEQYIFEDFKLRIPSGTSCAFVGPSGCGKSTLFSLLLRSYDVTKGAVLIDGQHDLRDLNLRWWLRNVGVVSQEARLFKGTIRDNVLYGVEEKLRSKIPNIDEAVMDAIKKANLQKLVEDKGLDFQVGERGCALSGGQKQRVCIARVFMKQPKILLLDEVTSALDPLSEAEVIGALEELMVNRTTFVIAHRLHTLTNVGKIFVLRDGIIVDQGSHQELVDKQGFYKTMWDKQQQEAAAGEIDYGGLSKSDVLSLLDLLSSFERSLPSEVVSMLNQLRPKEDEEYDAEEEMEAAEKEADEVYFPVSMSKSGKNFKRSDPLGNELFINAYGSGTEALTDFAADNDND